MSYITVGADHLLIFRVPIKLYQNLLKKPSSHVEHFCSASLTLGLCDESCLLLTYTGTVHTILRSGLFTTLTLTQIHNVTADTYNKLSRSFLSTSLFFISAYIHVNAD